MCVVDPGALAGVRTEIMDSPPGESSPFVRRLAGHIAYLDRDYSAAAEHYASVLSVVPYDLDTWSDFAFALRHLGHHAEAEVVIFELASVSEVATQVVVGGSAAAHLAFLRWWAT
jgi:hypothetical protein